MQVETLRDLLVDEMRDLYDAEKQLVNSLPKMAKNVNSDELREAILHHLEETKNQVTRLEQAFEHLNANAKSKPCKGMKGLVEEGSETMDEDMEDVLHDLAVIGAAQRVEHYEISAYGTARAMAEQLGENEVASLLEQTEDEEKAADQKLSEVAKTLYEEAPGETMEEEESEEVGAGTSRTARRGAMSAGSRRSAGGRQRRVR
jgi:ferritin-like metal-binding protein YciE